MPGQKVWLIERNGKNLRQLFPHGKDQLRPAFSPDGSKVAIIVCNLLAVTYTGEVFVIDVKSQQVTALRVTTGQALVPDATSRLNWIP